MGNLHFQVGDTVCLEGDVHLMTVERTPERLGGMVFVIWFVGTVLHRGSYPAELLALIER